MGNTIECLSRLQASLQKDSSSFAQRQMVSTWIIYCSRNNLPVLSDVLRQMARNEETQRVNFNWKYHWHSVNLDLDSLDFKSNVQGIKNPDFDLPKGTRNPFLDSPKHTLKISRPTPLDFISVLLSLGGVNI